MSGSTLLLILKSLFPFAKELILKDKDLSTFLLTNKLASIMLGCLIFLFVIFVYVSEVADGALKEVEKQKFTSGYQAANIIDLKAQLEHLSDDKLMLMDQLKKCGVPPATSLEAPSTHVPTARIKAGKTKDKQVNEGLKSYIDARLRALEQNGK